MEVRYIVNVTNIVEKLLFSLSYRKVAYDKYYKLKKIDNCIGLYYFLRLRFDELLLRNFIYFTPEGYSKLLTLFPEVEKCAEVIETENAEMNILSSLSDYRDWLLNNTKEISDIIIQNPDSMFNYELSKHINYLIDIKLEKIDNLDFIGYEGFKKFIQAIYFLSQNIDKEVLEDMVFYSNLINSDLKLLYQLDKEKVINFAKLTAFIPSETDLSQEIENYEYLTVSFSSLSDFYTIDEILSNEEVRKVLDTYKEYIGKDVNNIDFPTLDFIISIFVDKREDYLKLKNLYYSLWKKSLSFKK